MSKFILSILALFSCNVFAFDCAKAKSETEKAICSDSKDVPFILKNGVSEKDCDDSQIETSSYFPRLTGKIIGKGRIYFYKSPTANCASINLFLVAGDKVVVYESTVNGEFESVLYITKGGNNVIGWIISKNISHTGTLGN